MHKKKGSRISHIMCQVRSVKMLWYIVHDAFFSSCFVNLFVVECFQKVSSVNIFKLTLSNLTVITIEKDFMV